MDKIRLGFVPCHRYPYDEDWAVEMRQRCLKALRGLEDIDVVVPSPGLVHNGLARDDAGAQATIDLFAQRNVQGVLLGTMTYGDEVAAVTIAEALNVPVAVFGTQEGPFTEEGNRRSDSFCGTLGITSGLYRHKIPYLFLGVIAPEDEEFIQSVGTFARACAIYSGFIGARVGLLGQRSERSEAGLVNEAALQKRFRQRVIPVELAQVLTEAAQIADDDHRVVAAVRGMGKEANCSACDDAALAKMARLELTLKKLFEERGLVALTASCTNDAQGRYGVAFCYTLSRLTAEGLLAGCEADVYGALTMLVQYLAAFKSSVPQHIDWAIQHQELRNVFLAWNCGNAPACLAADSKTVMVREQASMAALAGADKAQGAVEFQVTPGVVTLCRLVEFDGQFKMLIATGEIVPGEDALRGAWAWVKVPDLEQLYRVLAEQGFPQHASMIHGDVADAVQDFCRFAGIEVVRA